MNVHRTRVHTDHDTSHPTETAGTRRHTSPPHSMHAPTTTERDAAERADPDRAQATTETEGREEPLKIENMESENRDPRTAADVRFLAEEPRRLQLRLRRPMMVLQDVVGRGEAQGPDADTSEPRVHRMPQVPTTETMRVLGSPVKMTPDHES